MPHNCGMPKYASILETVGNTPVVKIGKLAPAGMDLYVKIEAFNPLGSVKDRLALGIIEAAERSGALRPGQTVIEATSGNTGIGLAMVCAQKGYPLVIVMAESFTIPQVFVGGAPVGGCIDTLELFRTGKLQARLSACGVAFDATVTGDPARFLPKWVHPR